MRRSGVTAGISPGRSGAVVACPCPDVFGDHVGLVTGDEDDAGVVGEHRAHGVAAGEAEVTVDAVEDEQRWVADQRADEAESCAVADAKGCSTVDEDSPFIFWQFPDPGGEASLIEQGGYLVVGSCRDAVLGGAGDGAAGQEHALCAVADQAASLP